MARATRWDALVGLHAVSRKLIAIELTEDAPDRDPLGLSIALNSLRLLGYGVAIADFGIGIGIALLKLLANLPLTQLKLDRSFVADLPGDSSRTKICKSMIGLAPDLGVEWVAEGIETEAQRLCLQALGCEMGQGFPWAGALPRDRFLARANDWYGWEGL